MDKSSRSYTEMHFVVHSTDSPPYDWKDFLLKSDTGTIYNTAEYAEYAEKLLRWKPQFLRLVDSKGNIVLQNLLFEYNRGLKKVPGPIRNMYKRFFKILRWNYGPIAASQDTTTYFFKYLKTTKNQVYGITHPFTNLPDINFSKQKWATFVIDLHKTKQDLYQNLEKNSARKNIERSIERNVTIEEITDKSLDEYYHHLKNYKDPEGKKHSNPNEMHDFWYMLKRVGFTGFLARKEGIPIGGLTFSFFNKYINEWGVARSQIDTDQKLYSQDLIKWKIIEWGIENKMNWYDLTGFDPNPTSKKSEGLLRYKKKWGGKQYDLWIIGK